MKHSTLIPGFVILFLLLRAGTASASDYPEIKVLSGDDPLFIQHQSELQDFYRLSRVKSDGEFPPVSIFEYHKRKTEDLFSLNARLGLPYDTLATLNGTANTRAFDARGAILIASQPGIFVDAPPRTALEDMMLSSRLADGKKPQKLVVLRNGKRDSVFFFPGELFSPVERAYFLGILYDVPIARGQITSTFGMRKDPFTGHQEFHTGVDIGAAEGAEVHAARDGTVTEAGISDALGNYVVLAHPGGYQTAYGHLSAINVKMGQQVSVGSVIGAVGHTGRATGPHLHFEVLKKGSPTDPLPLLARGKS